MRVALLLVLTLLSCSREAPAPPREEPAAPGDADRDEALRMRNCPCAVPSARTASVRAANGVELRACRRTQGCTAAPAPTDTVRSFTRTRASRTSPSLTACGSTSWRARPASWFSCSKRPRHDSEHWSSRRAEWLQHRPPCLRGACQSRHSAPKRSGSLGPSRSSSIYKRAPTRASRAPPRSPHSPSVPSPGARRHARATDGRADRAS